jgi:DNA polymerase III gamma/tau subunit
MMKDWIEHFRNLMLLRHLKRPGDVLNMSLESIDRLRAQSARLSPAFVNDGIFALAGTLHDARWSTQPRVLLEVGIIRMATAQTPADAFAAESAQRAAPAGEQLTKPARVEGAGSTEAPARAEVPAPRAKTSAPAEIPLPAMTSVPAKISAPAEASVPPAKILARPIEALNWRAVVEAAVKKNPSLVRLSQRSEPVETGEDFFVIEVFDELTKGTAEKGRELIEAAAAHVAGRPLRMVCRLNEDRPPAHRTAATSRNTPSKTPEAPPPEEDAVQMNFRFDS